MSARRVDQLVDGYASGDAISIEARCLRAHLRAMGFDSEILAVPGRIAPGIENDCRTLDALAARAPEAVILHSSIDSPAAEAWAAGAFRRILLYHNITPARWFRGYDDAVAAQLEVGHRTLPRWVAAAHATAAVSEFNAKDLREAGADDVRVFPLASASENVGVESDAAVAARLAGSLTNVLCVGRIAPNKCLEDALEAFAWYQRAINPLSRLVLVGSPASCPRYAAMLRMYAAELNVPNVCFEGYVSPAGLAACYGRANVLLSTSRHEGFCLPLIDAMRHGVPVIARAAGGIPESTGGAGILFDDCGPRELARLIGLAISDPALRAEVLAAQRARVAALDARPVAEDLRALLASAGIR